MPRWALVSFDVEEFDTPLEYGQMLPLAEQLAISRAGLDRVADLLDRRQVRATLFTTARYALTYPDQVRALAQRHEIASHGFEHGRLADGDLARSKHALEQITGLPVHGFRRARMAATEPGLIRAAGYRYDSSENPTWVPGRYNNFFHRRTAHLDHGLLRIPASVTPIVRFPLFWLSFKNFPPWFIRRATGRVLDRDGCLNIYFHPWEFADLNDAAIPRFIRRIDGADLIARLDRYLAWLADRAQFITFSQFDLWFRQGAGVPAPPAPT